MKNFEDFFKNKTTYDKISSKLYWSKKDNSSVYTYLGETNSGGWMTKLEEFLLNHDRVELSQKEIDSIDKALSGHYPEEEWLRGSGRGFETRHVSYPPLESVVNSRFGACWFLKREIGRWGEDKGWDMCVQKFTDDWFVVNIGDGAGRFNYWFFCDEFNGLLELIKDKFINIE